VRIATGAIFPIHDSSQAVVAFCSYPVATRSQPNLWFVDAPAPVQLPSQYPWPDHLLGSYGNYLLAHRPRGRDLGLIDESGRLAVQLRCPRAITSICVTEVIWLTKAGRRRSRRKASQRPRRSHTGLCQPVPRGGQSTISISLAW
jgi:hypothetical protein